MHLTPFCPSLVAGGAFAVGSVIAATLGIALWTRERRRRPRTMIPGAYEYYQSYPLGPVPSLGTRVYAIGQDILRAGGFDPVCCHIDPDTKAGCGKPAEWQVHSSPDPYQGTEACSLHVGALLDPEAENRAYWIGERR